MAHPRRPLIMTHNATVTGNKTIFLINLKGPFTAFEYVYLIALSLFVVCVLLCVASCVFGVATWILIPRWRKFQNYVFLNLFFVCAITMTCYYVMSNVYPRSQTHCMMIIFAFVLSRVVMCHWFLIATVMFYMDIVKVFQSNIKRRYLLVNLYAWFVPIIEVLVLYSVSIPLKIDSDNVETFTCVALIMSLLGTALVYVRVLYTLVSLAVRNVGSKKDVCHKIILCTAACMTSGVSTFLPVVVAEIVYKDDYVMINSICIFTLLNIIAIILFFLSMKTHRLAWEEYWRRRQSVTTFENEMVI